MASNGEVEGPDEHASQRPRARNIDWVPRPQTDHASRPPPTIVRQHHRAIFTARVKIPDRASSARGTAAARINPTVSPRRRYPKPMNALHAMYPTTATHMR